MKTTWTDQRLERLFAHYNRKYWRGQLPGHRVEIQDLQKEQYIGLYVRRARRILLDVGQHKSDQRIRSTLLHEMCHAAAGRDSYSHGYHFWLHVERLLRRGAPIRVGEPEAPHLKILAGAIPRKLRLARKAMVRVEMRRERRIEAYVKKHNLGPAHTVKADEIVQEFEDAASELSWSKALLAIGGMYGLIDVGGKPTSRWAARVLAEAQKVHQRSRREYLEYEKRRKALFSEVEAERVSQG